MVMEYEQSGLTRRAFCLQYGLSLATLDNYRKHQVRGLGQSQDAVPATIGASTVKFVPVELVERSSLVSPMADNHASLFIELASGRHIGVTAGFDTDTLTRLIAVLEQV